MWKTAGVFAFTATLALCGAAQANDPAMNTTSDETQLEQQSGNEKAIELSGVRGEDARKIQETLKEQGFYEGQIDGVLGPLTQQALMKFQQAKGLQGSGKLDSKTASALGVELSDVQPVRGNEPANTNTGEEEPAATPMTNSGSTTTEPDSGVDKAGSVDQQSGTDMSTGDDKNLGTKEPIPTTTPGDDMKQPQSGNDNGTDPMNDDAGTSTDDQSGDASDNATGTGSNTSDTNTEPQSGHDSSMGGVDASSDTGVVDETESEIEPQSGTTSFDKKTIKQVEQALKDKQLFSGKVDGVLDEQTTSAIRRFQTENGIVVTGKLDAKTLDALGVKTKAGTGVGNTTDNPNPTMTPAEPINTPSDPMTPNPNSTPNGDPNNPNPVATPNPGGIPPR